MLTSKDIKVAGLDLGFTGEELDERLRIMQECLPNCYHDDIFLHTLCKKADAKKYFAKCWEVLEDVADLFSRYSCLGFVPWGAAQRAEAFESYMRAVQKHFIDRESLEQYAGRICEKSRFFRES